MLLLINQGLTIFLSEIHSEPCQISKMELIAKIVNDFQPLTIFTEKLYLKCLLIEYQKLLRFYCIFHFNHQTFSLYKYLWRFVEYTFQYVTFPLQSSMSEKSYDSVMSHKLTDCVFLQNLETEMCSWGKEEGKSSAVKNSLNALLTTP